MSSRGLLVLALSTCSLIGVTTRVAAQEANPTSVASALYVRNDSDGTTVITPRLAVGAPLGETTRVDAVYTVDVWTSASVDIRASASKAITEQRDEIDLSFEHGFTDITLGGSYRYSTEYDYESHGGTFGGSYDFADNNATLALRFNAFFDQVGRAGDPGFQKQSNTFGARASYTQVLDVSTIAQVVYEFGAASGYLSSPYRFVRFTDDTDPNMSLCTGTARNCLPEENPDRRTRHAIGLIGRRALGETLAVGASYRFYLDSWSVSSHTVALDATWTPAERWMFSLGYRLYLQSDASHYRTSYAITPQRPKVFTRDKELSALTSHRLELEVTRTWSIDDEGGELNAVLLVAPAYFAYSNFPLLDSIRAIEATFALEVRL